MATTCFLVHESASSWLENRYLVAGSEIVAPTNGKVVGATRTSSAPSYQMTVPYDGAFTLFRETTDPKRPCTFELSTTIDGREYTVTTRLVVTPPFSYGTNFLPQLRVSWKTLGRLEKEQPNAGLRAYVPSMQEQEGKPAQ